MFRVLVLAVSHSLAQNILSDMYTYRFASQVIQVRALEQEIPELPSVVPLALLTHPAFTIWLPDLFNNCHVRAEDNTIITSTARTGSHITIGFVRR